MKYGIISLPRSDRAAYKADIRKNVHYPEVDCEAFDAYANDPVQGLKERGLSFNTAAWGNAKRGELGVWLSNYDRWVQAAECGPLIVFEDDAVVDETFMEKFEAFMSELPEDWGLAALWVPENQRQDFLYGGQYDKHGHLQFNGYVLPDNSIYKMEGAAYASRVYQGYGMVSLVYSAKGAARLVELAHTRGVDNPVDCWVYEEVHKGNLTGFAPQPEYASIVTYDWAAESHVQLTERAL